MSDPWWRRRKKKSRWFNDIYDELEKLGDMIDETMQKAFDNAPENAAGRPNRVQGFSIKFGADGKPRIREVGGRQSLHDETEISDDLEPLVDLIEEGNLLVVLVALSGVSKDDIDLRVTENCLTVSVDTVEFEWYDEFKLPTRVKPKSARATYKNGVLEVRLEKLESIVKDNGISMKK
ncbi:MAG: heat-shock protein Hsp20 [Candidatus Bathyarchaeum sp.]|nr:MAG: heat-shock protein Hsp20 [Candidatus Bathyarchaeum sp.]